MTPRKSPAPKRLHLRALGEAITTYEAARGTITAGERASQARADRRAARLVGRSPRAPAHCRLSS
jgi:hypothetical protein